MEILNHQIFYSMINKMLLLLIMVLINLIFFSGTAKFSENDITISENMGYSTLYSSPEVL